MCQRTGPKCGQGRAGSGLIINVACRAEPKKVGPLTPLLYNLKLTFCVQLTQLQVTSSLRISNCSQIVYTVQYSRRSFGIWTRFASALLPHRLNRCTESHRRSVESAPLLKTLTPEPRPVNAQQEEHHQRVLESPPAKHYSAIDVHVNPNPPASPTPPAQQTRQFLRVDSGGH